MQVEQIQAEADAPSVRAFLRDQLAAHAQADYYPWLYRRNPHGCAQVWVVRDERDGALIGVAAAFPRRLRIRGREVLGWNLGDFAVRPDHRSLGPAVALQRACLQSVLAGDVALAYDHPAQGMMAIYQRMGIGALGQVVRFAKPLRVDAQVGRVLRDGPLARAASGLGNQLLALGGARRRTRGFNVARLHGPFDERVTELDERVGASLSIVGARAPEYLNWRYVDHPLYRHEIWTVEDGGRLLGYAVLLEQQGHTVLRDLFGDLGGGALDELLAAVIDDVQRGGRVHTLSARTLATSPLVPLLARWGFRAREDCPFVVCTRPGGPWDGTVNVPANWFLTDGDRDV